MRPIHQFDVVATLPERLERLRDLAYNLRWSWNNGTLNLFRRLDATLWEHSGHNPIAMLGSLSQTKIDEALSDEGFLSHYDRICEGLDEYVGSTTTWFHKTDKPPLDWKIAYFSMEFGVAECLPIYSGGLGVLAGDHMKSTSDLGLPLVGVGLLYQKGYFRQYLNPDGWQQEHYITNDFHNMPVSMCYDGNGNPITVKVELLDRQVTIQLWEMKVGRTKIVLLDTNIPENAHEDRNLTAALYGGGSEMRMTQEIILGIGGTRALKKLDIHASVYHMNEGHAAFLALERIRSIMHERNVKFSVAVEAVRAGTIFTTHTPVPAGIDRFDPNLIDKYFSSFRNTLGLTKDEFLALGREDPTNEKEWFCMAILAIKLSSACNGVSKLHGEVSRHMWQGVWPKVPVEEVGISHVTNGIHFNSWVSPEMGQLFDRYLGPQWQTSPDDREIWERIEQIPPSELWRTHERRRERLVAYARRRLRKQLESRGAPPSELKAAEEVLDPSALTIGFARRFATYKRATLVFRDIERLANILNIPGKPVQLIFAGKAHPKDNEGKELIRSIVELARKPEFRNRIVFLEDYDISVSRYLVQGCDVWLNTPRRLEEASGTSGMKASANAAMNLSILDGWWDEAYRPGLGWIIGHGEIYEDFEYQDHVEARTIYNLLEKEIVPLFYDSGHDGLPRKWIRQMKTALRALGPAFNSNRMVHEYAENFYFPAVKRSQEFLGGELEKSKGLADWKEKIERVWPKVAILNSKVDLPEQLSVGEMVSVNSGIDLGELSPEDISVEIYAGTLDSSGEIKDGKASPMKWTNEATQRDGHQYTGEIGCNVSGHFGVTIRVRPSHKSLSSPFEMRLIKWATAPERRGRKRI